MPRKFNIVYKLIAINAAVFLLMQLIKVFGGDIAQNATLEWLAVPTNLKSLIFRVWTPFTYMFLHAEFFHILGNMLWLFFLGTIFHSFLGEKKLLAVYILGGLAGAALFIISYNIAPFLLLKKVDGIALGASASVSAIVIAVSVYKPNFVIRPFGLFDLQLRWLAIIFVIIDVFSLFGNNTGGHIAHLGGAIYGAWFGYKQSKNQETTEWIIKIFNGITGKNKRKRRSKMKVSYKSEIPRSDYEYNRDKADAQEEIDRILDKISQSGYDSLSKKEKNFLFHFGKKK